MRRRHDHDYKHTEHHYSKSAVVPQEKTLNDLINNLISNFGAARDLKSKNRSTADQIHQHDFEGQDGSLAFLLEQQNRILCQ